MEKALRATEDATQISDQRDARRFRYALGNFPTGVAVVTTVLPNGEHLGLTVSSFNSVSLAPPLILFSVARSALGFGEWMGVKHYTISLLHDRQQHVSTRFGRPAPDKWNGVDFETCDRGIRKIVDALATFECEAYAQYEGGDHVIMVGRVVSHAEAADLRNPLLFFRGEYRQLASDNKGSGV